MGRYFNDDFNDDFAHRPRPEVGGGRRRRVIFPVPPPPAHSLSANGRLTLAGQVIAAHGAGVSLAGQVGLRGGVIALFALPNYDDDEETVIFLLAGA